MSLVLNGNFVELLNIFLFLLQDFDSSHSAHHARRRPRGRNPGCPRPIPQGSRRRRGSGSGSGVLRQRLSCGATGTAERFAAPPRARRTRVDRHALLAGLLCGATDTAVRCRSRDPSRHRLVSRVASRVVSFFFFFYLLLLLLEVIVFGRALLSALFANSTDENHGLHRIYTFLVSESRVSVALCVLSPQHR